MLALTELRALAKSNNMLGALIQLEEDLDDKKMEVDQLHLKVSKLELEILDATKVSHLKIFFAGESLTNLIPCEVGGHQADRITRRREE